MGDGGYMMQEKESPIELGQFKYNPTAGTLVLAPKYKETTIDGRASFPSANELLLELPHSTGAMGPDNHDVLLLKRSQE